MARGLPFRGRGAGTGRFEPLLRRQRSTAAAAVPAVASAVLESHVPVLVESVPPGPEAPHAALRRGLRRAGRNPGAGDRERNGRLGGHARGGRSDGPSAPRQRLPDGLSAPFRIRAGRSRRSAGGSGPGHRLRRLHRSLNRAAPRLSSAEQRPLDQSGDPGERTRAAVGRRLAPGFLRTPGRPAPRTRRRRHCRR